MTHNINHHELHDDIAGDEASDREQAVREDNDFERDDIEFPLVRHYPLGRRVLAVARTRIEGRWGAYIDAVPGIDFDVERDDVLDHGSKLREVEARAFFPYEPFASLPYAH